MLLLLFVFLRVDAADASPLRVFVSWPGYNYEPFYAWDEGNQSFTGIDPEIIDLLLKSANREYKYVFPRTTTNTPRMEVLERRVADISIRSFSITKDRAERVDFTSPYFTDGLSLIVRKDSGIKGIDDLKDKKVLASINTTGYLYAKKHAIAKDIVTDVPSANLSSPIALLVDGRVDAYINDRSNLKVLASQNEELMVLDETLNSESWGIAVKRGNTELFKVLKDQLKVHIANGNIKKIFDKHKVPYYLLETAKKTVGAVP